MLDEQIKKDKPEIKAIIGMLKGFGYSLQAGCTLDQRQMSLLFLLLKTVIKPIEDVNNRGVMKAGMKLLA